VRVLFSLKNSLHRCGWLLFLSYLSHCSRKANSELVLNIELPTLWRSFFSN
jgi:hypothetical protein